MEGAKHLTWGKYLPQQSKRGHGCVVRVRQMGTIECKEEIIGTGYYAAPFVESHGDLSSLSGYKSTGNDHAFLLVKFFLILPPKTSGMTLKQ
jgi:hypothetical protein